MSYIKDPINNFRYSPTAGGRLPDSHNHKVSEIGVRSIQDLPLEDKIIIHKQPNIIHRHSNNKGKWQPFINEPGEQNWPNFDRNNTARVQKPTSIGQICRLQHWTLHLRSNPNNFYRTTTDHHTRIQIPIQVHQISEVNKKPRSQLCTTRPAIHKTHPGNRFFIRKHNRYEETTW